MKIKAKSSFWTGGKNGRYKIPKEFIEADNIIFEFEEVAKFAEQNKRVKYIYVAFETEEEKRIYLEKLTAIEKEKEERNKKYMEMCLSLLPKEAAAEIKSWEIINKSPYSNSFYNSEHIDWGYKPEGSLRLSDHWNFGEDIKHCRLNTTSEYISGTWILARYENGIYVEIKRF